MQEHLFSDFIFIPNCANWQIDFQLNLKQNFNKKNYL